MKRRDVERRLRALGSETAPPPGADFVDALSARLHQRGPGRVRRHRPMRRLGFALAGVAVVAAVVAASVSRPQAPSGLELVSSSDTTVTLPDGRTLDDPDDVVLPEGAIVETGPKGQVRAGGLLLGPRRRARVLRGRLVIDGTPRPAPAARPGARTTAAPERPAPLPVRGGGDAVVTSPRPVATARPVRQQSLGLACRSGPSIGCRWTASTDPRFAGYRLLRDGGVVFRTRDRGQTSFVDGGVRPGTGHSYVVQAVDGSGRVIASGGPVRAFAGRADRRS